MTKHLLLFDIDGTILQTGGAGLRAMLHVGETLFDGKLIWDGVETAGHLDPLIFAEAAAQSELGDGDDHHRRFRDGYLERLAMELEANPDKVIAMPGIHEAIEALRKRRDETGDVVLGLLTGNYGKAVPIKLAAVGVDVDWFEVTAFGDDGPDRPALVEVAMERFFKLTGERADPRKVIVIGDTPRDVACAKAHGCFALAVATGRFGVEELAATEADMVIKDLADPAPLLRLLESVEARE